MFRRTRHHPEASQRPRDPIDAETSSAVVFFRTELLFAAVAYGVYWGAAEGGTAWADEWRSWLGWLEALLRKSQAAADAPSAEGHSGGRSELPAWLDGMREVVEAHEHGVPAGSEPFGLQRSEWAIDQLERLAERARPIERLGGEPLGEIEGRDSTAGVALLSAVQSSLVLTLSRDEERRALRTTPHEIHELLTEARERGVWDLFIE